MKLRSLPLFLGLAVSTSTSAKPGPLPFIADDFSRARAEALSRGVPLFVDIWAPW